MAKRDVVFPDNPHALFEEHGYSPAVRSNGFLFVSGMVGARQNGTAEPDLPAQVQLAFDNLNATLNAAGVTFEDVVDVTVFLVDAEKNFETIFPTFQRNWGEKPYPNISVIGATWLAGFTFEIKVIAKLPDGDAK